MIEYLFVDAPRLDRYYEQISSPVTYDKVPEWKVALGLTGPRVESTQARPGRVPSTHEKIKRFVDYIDEHDLAADKRPSILSGFREKNKKPFVIETLSARRARIKQGDDVLNIWVSMLPDEAQSEDGWPFGALYLVEDFRGDDDSPNVHSGYSSLHLLAEELQWLKNTAIVDPLDKLRFQDDATRLFALDPVGILASMGAQIGPERHIKTIYRIRAECWEMEGQDHRGVTIIG